MRPGAPARLLQDSPHRHWIRIFGDRPPRAGRPPQHRPDAGARATEEYTRYDLVFEDLRVRIERDVDLIKATGNSALRPAVFFLTDGKPNPPDQHWREAFSTVRTIIPTAT